jgi:hypothetical protein
VPGQRAAQQARLPIIDNLPEVQDDLEDGAVVVYARLDRIAYPYFKGAVRSL